MLKQWEMEYNICHLSFCKCCLVSFVISIFCCENTWLQNTTNDDKFHLTFVIGHSSCLFLNDTCNQNVKTYQLLLAMQEIYATCNLSFSCFANMTPVIKIYMTYYDVICHLSWSCRMVYVFHLLLQTWQSQSYSDITNDMTFIIYQRLLQYPFSVIVKCCNNGTCEQWRNNNLTF